LGLATCFDQKQVASSDGKTCHLPKRKYEFYFLASFFGKCEFKKRFFPKNKLASSRIPGFWDFLASLAEASLASLNF